jgi:hypothetical protein
MTDKRPTISKLESFLRNKEAKLAAQLESMRCELEAVRCELEDYLAARSQEAPAHPISVHPPIATSPTPTEQDLSDLTLKDAIVAHIDRVGRPQSPSEIWESLSQQGVEPLSDDPVKAVSWALRKLKMKGEVVMLSFGQWDLRKRYGNTKLKEIAKLSAGRGGQTRATHSKRTKAGIERHIAAGGRIGAPRKFNAEMAAEMKRLLGQQMSKSAVCASLGVSVQTYYNNRDLLKVWKEGEPWPPRRPTKEQLAAAELEPQRDTQAQLRVVK